MLRRLAILATTAVSLAGCSNFRDAFSAHADVVARAGGQELTVTRLAELLAPQKNVPLRRDVVDRIADLWVDYQLLAQAVAGGDSLTDTATVMAASWPAVMQRLADQLHDQLIVQKAHLTDAQVDSAYNGGSERWLEHLLVAVRPDTTEAVKAAKRRIAEGYLAQLRRGTPFARLAKEKSEDQASAVNGGTLGLVGRGRLAKPFEDAAWLLQPGQTSGLVETPYGYHIIRRPALAEVRDSFRLRLRDADIARRDSVFLDSLATKTGIKVRGAAPAIVRLAVTDTRAAKRSGRVLATYQGGELTARRFARWVQAFPPQTRQQIIQADTSTLKEFVQSIARNEVLLQMISARKLQLSAAARDTIIQKFRSDIHLLLAAVGVAPESLALDTMARHNRPAAAARRVDGYFVGITSSPPLRTFYEVPPFLADQLREKFPWNVSTAGVDRALERAKELRGPEAPSAGQLQPAPGGPPIGARPGPMPQRPSLPQGNAPRGAAPTRP